MRKAPAEASILNQISRTRRSHLLTLENKNQWRRVKSYMETIEAFSLLFASCYDLQETRSLQNATGNQASRVWIKTQKRFILAEEFIRERNGSSDISMTNNFPNLNGLGL